jgi:beta-phosphoglucomutase-like phosphatase (HAD superfamily)
MSDYNRLIIFDLDGVLIDSRDVHYHALNMALESISPLLVISREEHLSTYDGLPTTAKLKLLTQNKKLSPDLYDTVWKEKQSATIKILSRLQPDYKLIDIFRELKERGFKIAVASNSIRNTVVTTLVKLGLMEYIDYYQSNEDVSRNKPFPEMYWNCMMALYAIPSTTIIVEDSHIGRQGAIDRT